MTPATGGPPNDHVPSPAPTPTSALAVLAPADWDRVHGPSAFPPGQQRDADSELQLHRLRQRSDHGQGFDGGDHLNGLGERQAPRRRRLHLPDPHRAKRQRPLVAPPQAQGSGDGHQPERDIGAERARLTVANSAHRRRLRLDCSPRPKAARRRPQRRHGHRQERGRPEGRAHGRVPPGPARRCWREPPPARPACRSSPSAARAS